MARPSGYYRHKDFQPDSVANFPAYGQMYVSSSAATTLTAAGGAAKLSGTTTADGVHKFSMSANNRLLCGADAVALYQVTVSCSVLSSANAIATLSIAKNGTVITSTKCTANVLAASTPLENIALCWVGPLANADYIEIFGQVSADANLTLSKAQVCVHQVY